MCRHSSWDRVGHDGRSSRSIDRAFIRFPRRVVSFRRTVDLYVAYCNEFTLEHIFKWYSRFKPAMRHGTGRNREIDDREGSGKIVGEMTERKEYEMHINFPSNDEINDRRMDVNRRLIEYRIKIFVEISKILSFQRGWERSMMSGRPDPS